MLSKGPLISENSFNLLEGQRAQLLSASLRRQRLDREIVALRVVLAVLSIHVFHAFFLVASDSCFHTLRFRYRLGTRVLV